MRIVDLTLPIKSNMAALPGIPAYIDNPTLAYPLSVMSDAQEAALKDRGLQFDGTPERSNHMLSKLEITTHIGTHIDAPIHMLEDTWTIDEIPLESIVKKGVIVPLTGIEPGGCVTADAIEASLADTGVEITPDIIPVLYTGWAERMWGTPEFWNNTIWMHKDAAELVASKGTTGVAIDFFPEFPFWRDDITRPDGQPAGLNHKTFLGQQTIIIQMLTNISQIGDAEFTLVAVPLRLEGLDGSPARVFAMIG